jgi:hypothetical protein
MLSEEGSWKDEPDPIVDAYYKAPWCLAAIGDATAANRSLGHVEDRFLGPDGDVAPVHSAKLQERYPLIPHAHLAIGAVEAGRDDLADKLLDFLVGQRNPGLGAWGDRVDGQAKGRLDAISTAAIGLAFLERGHLDEARAAALFLERLLESQPQAETDFFTTVNNSGDLLTDFPTGPSTVDRRVTFAKPFQVWHAIGFPIMLLGRLAEVDDDPRWMRLAGRFTEMFDQSQQAWIDLSVGKAAWGFAVMYRATGDRQYRSRALRALRGIVSWQDPDGGWLTCLDGEGGTAGAVTSLGYEVCTELVMWLGDVGRIVADGDGAGWVVPAQATGSSRFDDLTRSAERILAQQRRLGPKRWRLVRTRAGRVARRRPWK